MDELVKAMTRMVNLLRQINEDDRNYIRSLDKARARIEAQEDERRRERQLVRCVRPAENKR